MEARAEALSPLMPTPLAPHTARSSRAPCARRHSAGEWSCGCTWCPTRERCPTRSGSACPQGWRPRGGPRISIPPVSPTLHVGRCWGLPSLPAQGSCVFGQDFLTGGQPQPPPGCGLHTWSRSVSGWAPPLGSRPSSPGVTRLLVALVASTVTGDRDLSCSAPPAPSSSCRRRTCRAT